MASQHSIPNIPRVISPSPTPSESSGKDGYIPPTTRSKAARVGSSVGVIEEDADAGASEETDPDLLRARSRSRSPQLDRIPAMTSIDSAMTSGAKTGTPTAGGSRPTRRKAEEPDKKSNGTLKGPVPEQDNSFLSPASAYNQGFGSAYWRSFSRSPSPFGLIPIHREWRAFIHKHEVPRKALHVSIGFVTLWLYRNGNQISQIHPVLLTLLVPILSADVLRFRWPAFNRFYIRVLGAFMRESEAHDRYNGVISYIAGLWATMYFCRKDVAVLSVLLLSWCDTAASTFGRAFGKYTPRIRRGKSLAGSLAAFVFGVGSSVLFYGLIAPSVPAAFNQGVDSFAFDGHLSLPAQLRDALSLTPEQATISGGQALGMFSVVSGFVASVSEAIDIFGLDDNLTIPILSGIGLGAFLWVFGSS